MPVEQAHQRLGIAEGDIHELQEQLQRVSAGHQATHQLLSILRSKVDTRSSVRLVVSKTLMPDRFGKKNSPIWITWSYLARDFVGVVHATLKQAMKAAKNKKQPISVTHGSRIATFLFYREQKEKLWKSSVELNENQVWNNGEDWLLCMTN